LKRPSVSIINMGFKFPVGNLLVRTLRGRLTGMFKRKKMKQDFIALENIDLEIHEGEVIGIIGRNGAGKSTLLRVIAGIYAPDSGSVLVRGKVSLLASVGVGFNRELTGRENIYLYGAIIGLKKEIIQQKMDQIITFSQLDEFIDSPLKTYSSGMKARLGFSVAANLEADILLIDEVFGVGDASFRERSKTKIFEMVRQSNRTVVIVTHSSGILTQLCDRVLLIDDGRIVAKGTPDEMIDAYEDIISDGKGPSRRERNKNAILGPAAIQRAATLVERGQFNDAKALLEANLSNTKNINAARYQLGQLAMKKGEENTACQHWSYMNIDEITDERRLRRIGLVAKSIDLKLAREVAMAALIMDPDRSWAWQVFEACARSSDPAELLDNVPTQSPLIFKENPKRAFAVARLCFNLGHFSIAANFANTINTSSPSAKVLDFEGRAWHRTQNYSNALKCWVQLLDLNEKIPKNLDRAARAAFNIQEYESAYQYSIRLHTLNRGANDNLVLASKSLIRGKLDSKKKEITEFIAQASFGSKEAQLNLIKSLNELNETELAFERVKKALISDPDDVDFNMICGRLMMKSGDIEIAIEHFKNAQLHNTSRKEIPVYLARAYRRIGKLGKALSALEYLSESEEPQINARMMYASILGDVEDWERCLLAWKRIQSLQPNSSEYDLKIANCYLRMNRLDEAEQILNMTLSKGGDQFRSLSILRQVYWKQSRHDDALEIFKKLLTLDSDNTALWKNVISLSARLSRDEEVTIHLNRLENHFGKQEYGALNIALVYESLSMESKMRTMLSKFLRDAAGKPNILMNGSTRFYDLGRVDIAFILADEASKYNSKLRLAGLMMTKIYSLLESAGVNEHWLIENYNQQKPVCAPGLAAMAMINTTAAPSYQKPSLAKIAFVSHSIGIGGAERQIINTIKGFEKHFSPVPKMILYCTEWSEKEDTESYRRFVDERTTKLRTIVPTSEMMGESEEALVENFGKQLLDTIPRNIYREILGLYIQLKHEKPSVVHAFHDRINVVAGIASVLAGVPRVVLSTRSVSKHQTDVVNPFVRPLWFKDVYQALLSRPQVQMYHVSEAVSNSYNEWLDLPSRQKKVLYNSTDYNLMRENASNVDFMSEKRGLNESQNSQLIGGIMRFSSEKQPQLFIEAAAKILETNPKTNFVLLGDGPLMDQAKRTIRRYNLTDNIHLIGRSHQVYLWLQKMDLLMLTSKFEGLPNVLIEAQGFGVPVISTDAGGAKETFVEGKSGFLAKTGTANELAKLSVKALNDIDWMKNASKIASKNANKLFSIDIASANFLQLYDSIETEQKPSEFTPLKFNLNPKAATNAFIYVDDRNGKAGLLSAALRHRGVTTHMVRGPEQVPNQHNSFVYFFIDHLTFRNRDKIIAEQFNEKEKITMAPSIDELRVYDDKGAQQLEYGMIMPPALYSTNKSEAEQFIKNTDYPFVSKAIEGAHASNVRLIYTAKEARNELESIFSNEGKPRHESKLTEQGLTQSGYVLWQKFIPDNPNDWRMIMLGGKYAMVVHRQNRPDMPFASGSGLRTPENELSSLITGMLNWGREFVIEKRISVLAADVILDENKDYVLVETSTTWPTVMHDGNVVFKYENNEWGISDFRGEDIFELKAVMIEQNEFHEVM
jgi:ABC-type polysaccharide/polyol phosphate transport system ATPase subunit/glycosyltransferase involved in cell wall biosynthesis/lipopolysaccharide biosynthesis regulator YciM